MYSAEHIFTCLEQESQVHLTALQNTLLPPSAPVTYLPNGKQREPLFCPYGFGFHWESCPFAAQIIPWFLPYANPSPPVPHCHIALTVCQTFLVRCFLLLLYQEQSCYVCGYVCLIMDTVSLAPSPKRDTWIIDMGKSRKTVIYSQRRNNSILFSLLHLFPSAETRSQQHMNPAKPTQPLRNGRILDLPWVQNILLSIHPSIHPSIIHGFI